MTIFTLVFLHLVSAFLSELLCLLAFTKTSKYLFKCKILVALQ